MAVKPIIFSGPMVRALLEGRKTQTRRIVKNQHSLTVFGDTADEVGIKWCEPVDDDGKKAPYQWASYSYEYPEEGVCPLGQLYGSIGDLLYVRETCSAAVTHDELSAVRYEADQCWRVIDNTRAAADLWLEMYHYRDQRGATVPPIHMPRWASRMTLEVTDVRVERVQDIGEEDAKAEGAEYLTTPCDHPRHTCEEIGCAGIGYRLGFADLWHSLNEKRGFGWNTNPWVVALIFTVHKQNVDEFLKQREAA